MGAPYVGDFAHMFPASTTNKEIMITNEENNVLNNDANYLPVIRKTRSPLKFEKQAKRTDNLFGVNEPA